MAGKWHVIYQQLKSYIASNPSIEISPSVVVIGSDVRPEFYRLFNAVRMEFIKDNFPVELGKSYELSRNWTDISKSVIEDIHLEDIEMQAGVKWFLSDPVTGLIKGLYNPLFDLLKDRIDFDGFEQKAMEVASADYEKYFREGYQRWAIVSLIKLMAGDKVYTVMAVDERIDTAIMEGDPGIGLCEDSVPEAMETNQIIFENVEMCSFLTPRIIIHSKLLNCFVALRPDFYQCQWKARLLSENQEWFSIKAIKKDFDQSNLWPDLAIYVADDLGDLYLVADYHNVARPDIIVDFKEKDDWYEIDGSALIKRHYNILKPKLGAFMISRIPVPESVIKELEPNPQLQNSENIEFSAGTDESAPEQLVADAEPAAEIEYGELPQTTEVGLDYKAELNISLIGAGFDIDCLKPVIDTLADAIHPAKG